MSRLRVRTLVGLALFVPVAAILLVTFACLPAPVGDPDTAKVDAKLTGSWQSVPEAGKEAQESLIVLLRPWDTHTYYLQYLATEKKDDKVKTKVLHFKAWLTTLGGATFLTAETLDNTEYAFGDDGDKNKTEWVVGKVEMKDDTIKFRIINSDSPIVKDLKTREKLEAAIKAQVNNDELYGDAITFKKITKENAKMVEDALERANSGAK